MQFVITWKPRNLKGNGIELVRMQSSGQRNEIRRQLMQNNITNRHELTKLIENRIIMSWLRWFIKDIIK